MSTRRAKQIIYGAFYVLLWVFLIGMVYAVFIRPFTISTVIPCTPSTCAPTSTASLVPSGLLSFPNGGGNETFLAEISNANPDFGVGNLGYEINFYDASNTVLQSIPGESFIYPSQNKYVVLPNQSIPAHFDHMGFVIASAQWLPSSTLGINPSIEGGQFAVQNVQSNISSTTVSVNGQLANTSIASYEQVLVVILFKDQSGATIGASETRLDNMNAGESRAFSVLYPALPIIDPANHEIIVYALR